MKVLWKTDLVFARSVPKVILDAGCAWGKGGALFCLSIGWVTWAVSGEGAASASYIISSNQKILFFLLQRARSENGGFRHAFKR